MRTQLLLVICMLTMVFTVNRVMNDHYMNKIDHLTGLTIWLTEESYHAGCVQGRQGARSSFAKTCIELTTESLMRDNLTVKMEKE